MSFISRMKFGCAGLVLAAAVAVGAPALAQEISESHLAAAREAITALQATEQFDAILPATAAQLKQTLIQQTPDLQQQIDETVNEVALSLAARRGDLEREAASVYAKNFTEEELKAITEFYNSEAGKKLLENGPLVTREVLKAVEIWSNGISRDMSQQVAEKLQEELGNRPKIEPVPAQ